MDYETQDNTGAAAALLGSRTVRIICQRLFAADRAFPRTVVELGR